MRISQKNVLITCLSIVLLSSSCGVFRDVSKDIFKSKQKTEVKVEDNSTINEKVVDKGVVTTTETITGEATSPERKVTSKTPLENLKDGKPVTTLDSTGLITVSVWLDSLNNVIANVTKKEELIYLPNAGVRVTEERKDVITERLNQQAIKREESTKSQVTDKQVEKKGKNAFWFVIGGVALLGIIIWVISKNFKIKL